MADDIPNGDIAKVFGADAAKAVTALDAQAKETMGSSAPQMGPALALNAKKWADQHDPLLPPVGQSSQAFHDAAKKIIGKLGETSEGIEKMAPHLEALAGKPAAQQFLSEMKTGKAEMATGDQGAIKDGSAHVTGALQRLDAAIEGHLVGELQKNRAKGFNTGEIKTGHDHAEAVSPLSTPRAPSAAQPGRTA